MSLTRPYSTIRRGRSALLLTSAGLGLLLATPAMAQCQIDGAETASCESANHDAIGLFTGGNITVTTKPGFSVVADADEAALDIRASGSATYIDTNGSSLRNTTTRGLIVNGGSSGTGKVTVNSNGAITGRTFGAQFTSRGSGGIDVTLTGPVVGQTNFGIAISNIPVANNPLISNNLILRAGDVTGTAGIVAENRGGNGSIRITSTGTVTGTVAGNSAINTQHSVAGVGRDIVIEANNIVSVGNGIVAGNNGTGVTTILVHGTITTQQDLGILAFNGATATDATVTTEGIINTGRGGITIVNNGTGSSTVTALGKVTTQNLQPTTNFGIPSGNGISVANTTAGTSVTVRAAEIDSGHDGIYIRSNGTGATSLTMTGPIHARDGVGIDVVASGSTTDTVITSGAVTATGDAINVTHNGIGALRISATGDVVSESGVGIRARLDSGTDLTIDATNVRGSTVGIFASHSGTGDMNVTTTGLVRAGAEDGFGMSVRNSTSGHDISVRVNAVDAGTAVGIENAGTGTTSVTATGLVQGRADFGMNIRTRSSAGATTINVVDVFGAEDGIIAALLNQGDVVLNATGSVSGGSFSGISMSHSALSGNMTVNVSQVSGGTSGVSITNSSGNLRFTATGLLSGMSGSGASLGNTTSAADMIVNVVNAQGGVNGLVAFNVGTGTTQITATGTLIGTTGDGLFAGGGQGSGDMTVNIADATGGGRFGLVAAYSGAGNARITSTGTVRGATSAVRLATTAGTGTMFGDIRNAIGVDFGISTRTLGNGGLTLITRGTVEGGTAGIDIAADNGEAWTIANSGTIRNSSGLSSALAIRSTGGAGTITNSGALFGTVSLGAFDEDDGGGNQPTGGHTSNGRIGMLAVGDGHSLINSGTWNSIGGTSEFLGVNDVLLNQSGGRLIGGVNAGLAETTVYSGLETLNNNGTITMRDGGIGDIIRTDGDAFFGAGSVFAVDAGGAGSDRFVANGVTEIAAGALLQVGNPQAPVLGTRYTILESAGGVTGQFTFANQLISNFIGYRQGSTATTVFVELAQLRSFASAGGSFNQRSVGAALDTLPGSNPLAAAILVLPSDASAQNAFDALSGEIHPGVRTTLIEDSRLPRNAVLSRLDDREGGAIWGQAMGSWGQSDGGNGRGALKRDGYGALVGADVGLGDTITIGIAGAYLERDLDLPSRASTGTLRSTHLIGYAGASFGGFRLKAGGGYATARVDTVRGVAFPGIAQTLVAEYDGTMLQGFAEAGYRIPLGGGHVEPFAQVVTIRAETDGFAETGGGAALTTGKERDTATISTTGVRFETSQAGFFSVGGMAGWQHSFGTLDPATAFRFSAGSGFTVLGAARSRDGAVATIDARFRLSPGVTVAVSYDGVLGSSSADHSVTGGLRIAF